MLGYVSKNKRPKPPGRLRGRRNVSVSGANLKSSGKTSYNKPLPPRPKEVIDSITPKVFTVQDLLDRGSVQQGVMRSLTYLLRKKLDGKIKDDVDISSLADELSRMVVEDLIRSGPKLDDFPRQRNKPSSEETCLVESVEE